MSDDIDLLAAEYVLGTLDAAERASVAARRQREPALEAAIMAWEARLSPLDEAGPAEAPPEGLFAGIEARLGRADPPGNPAGAPDNTVVIALRRQVANWRRAAIAAMATAAALVVFVGIGQWRDGGAGRSFVAVLQRDAQSPAFLVSVDVVSRTLTVRPVAAEAQAGKSYELWLVNDTFAAPRSLGLISPDGFTSSAKLAGVAPEIVRASVLAVSLEPEGGSTTGVPTGPVLFTGKLVQSEP